VVSFRRVGATLSEVKMKGRHIMNIGWIGTGRMGYPMVSRLLKAGHSVRVWNRSVEKARPLAALGAQV
jgi:pyrroline-5-carboxylate reductase